MGRDAEGRPRKRIKHFNTPFEAHELTFTCYHRKPFLGVDRTRVWFLEALEKARTKHGFHLWAWVLMPDHVHLLIWFPEEEYAVEQVLQSLKQSVSRRALIYLRKHKPEGLAQLATGQKVTPYRFWQAGPGYDRNIFSKRALGNSVLYLHNNPVRKGLVTYPEDWPWSSYRAWHDLPEALVRLDKDSFPAV